MARIARKLVAGGLIGCGLILVALVIGVVLLSRWFYQEADLQAEHSLLHGTETGYATLTVTLEEMLPPRTQTQPLMLTG